MLATDGSKQRHGTTGYTRQHPVALFCLLLLIACSSALAQSGPPGVLQLQIEGFFNPHARDAAGRCCVLPANSTATKPAVCPGHCNTFFRVCAARVGPNWPDEPDLRQHTLACPLGLLITPAVANNSLEPQRDGLLLMRFPYREWPGKLKLVFEAWHDVTGNLFAQDPRDSLEAESVARLILRLERRHRLIPGEDWLRRSVHVSVPKGEASRRPARRISVTYALRLVPVPKPTTPAPTVAAPTTPEPSVMPIIFPDVSPSESIEDLGEFTTREPQTFYTYPQISSSSIHTKTESLTERTIIASTSTPQPTDAAVVSEIEEYAEILEIDEPSTEVPEMYEISSEIPEIEEPITEIPEIHEYNGEFLTTTDPTSFQGDEFIMSTIPPAMIEISPSPSTTPETLLTSSTTTEMSPKSNVTQNSSSISSHALTQVSSGPTTTPETFYTAVALLESTDAPVMTPTPSAPTDEPETMTSIPDTTIVAPDTSQWNKEPLLTHALKVNNTNTVPNDVLNATHTTVVSSNTTEKLHTAITNLGNEINTKIKSDENNKNNAKNNLRKNKARVIVK